MDEKYFTCCCCCCFVPLCSAQMWRLAIVRVKFCNNIKRRYGRVNHKLFSMSSPPSCAPSNGWLLRWNSRPRSKHRYFCQALDVALWWSVPLQWPLNGVNTPFTVQIKGRCSLLQWIPDSASLNAKCTVASRAPLTCWPQSVGEVGKLHPIRAAPCEQPSHAEPIVLKLLCCQQRDTFTSFFYFVMTVVIQFVIKFIWPGETLVSDPNLQPQKKMKEKKELYLNTNWKRWQRMLHPEKTFSFVIHVATMFLHSKKFCQQVNIEICWLLKIYGEEQ